MLYAWGAFSLHRGGGEVTTLRRLAFSKEKVLWPAWWVFFPDAVIHSPQSQGDALDISLYALVRVKVMP